MRVRYAHRWPLRRNFATQFAIDSPVVVANDFDGKSMENQYFLSTQNLIPCWSGFQPHFDPMLALFWEAFGVPWAFLAPILAARGAPRPLPRGLLGSLGVLKSLQASFMIDFTPTWCHFRGPGANLRRPRALFWTPGASCLAVLDCDFDIPSL